MNQDSRSYLIDEKTVEVLYIVCQRNYDLIARLEAIREACAEVGWTLGNA